MEGLKKDEKIAAAVLSTSTATLKQEDEAN